MKNFVMIVLGAFIAVAFFKWEPIKKGIVESSAGRPSQSGGGAYQGGTSGIPESVYPGRGAHSASGTSSNPGGIGSDEQAQLAIEWQNGGKRQSVEKLNAMKTTFDRKALCSAYHSADTVKAEAKAAIIDFERAIGCDDYVRIKSFDDKATDAMRRFNLNCRWRAGVSQGPGTHMHSGYVEGTWEPDVGYVMVDGRAMRELRCNHCQGSGSVRTFEVCSSCQGRGRVPNPAAQVSDAISMGVGIATMFGGHRGGRMPPMPRHRVAPEINCSTCNGQGRKSVTYRCRQCNGTGRVYEP